MADAHARLHQWRQASEERGEATGEDPIAPVAAELAREASLLCFDEFSGARHRRCDDPLLAVRRRCSRRGVVGGGDLDVAPADLYKDGLKSRAVPALHRAPAAIGLEVVELDARTDYRLEKLKRAPCLLCPRSAREADAALDAAFLALTGHDKGEPARIVAFGRHLRCAANDRRRLRVSISAASAGARSARPTILRSPSAFTRSVLDRIPALAPRRAQRGQAVHHPDRRPLRHARQADRFGGRRAGEPSVPARTARRPSNSRGPPRAFTKCAHSTTSRCRTAARADRRRAISAELPRRDRLECPTKRFEARAAANSGY